MADEGKDCTTPTAVHILHAHLCQCCSIELHAPSQQGVCLLLALKWPMRMALGLATVLDSRGRTDIHLSASNTACK